MIGGIVIGVVFALVVFGVAGLVWWRWFRADQRRYKEYLHRAGLYEIPTPFGLRRVPSDDRLRQSLCELNLPEEGNPDAESQT